MRQQGQQNRRGRARGGRKIQNPLSRNYDSNGPDVKIRGTAAHIAEKYTSLARDALSSGDTVAAENLFQHAEHYNRIIMAAQNPAGSEAQPVINDQANGAAANSEDGSEIQLDLQDAPASDGDRKSDKNGRSKNGRSSNGAGNNRRRRKRPNNGNGGGQQMKNGADSNDTQADKSPPPVREAKSEKAPEISEQSANGALL